MFTQANFIYEASSSTTLNNEIGSNKNNAPREQPNWKNTRSLASDITNQGADLYDHMANEFEYSVTSTAYN